MQEWPLKSLCWAAATLTFKLVHSFASHLQACAAAVRGRHLPPKERGVELVDGGDDGDGRRRGGGARELVA